MGMTDIVAARSLVYKPDSNVFAWTFQGKKMKMFSYKERGFHREKARFLF